MQAETDGSLEALHRLKAIEPPLYHTASPELSKTVRFASEYVFSSLNPFAPKSPFTNLLTKGFDAEQIWQQIDLQCQPLISSLRRQVRNFEKNPLEIEKQFNLDKRSVKKQDTVGKDTENVESEREDFDEEEENGRENENENENESDDDDDDNDDDGDMENEEIVNGVEDRFLKINELEEYLEKDEAREYGLKKEKKGNKRKRGQLMDAVEDEDEEDDEGDEGEDEDEGDDEELGLLELDDDDDDDENEMENARYDDFYGGKRTGQKKKSTQHGDLYDLDMGDEPIHDDNEPLQKKQSLSTHEKELENLRSEIEKMEKANLEPKTWTMQGEISADKRPKNSALEVDLDFEHNVRPAPVITEEFTASLEEMIQKRVLEARFDEVQKPPAFLEKAPREKKELDENKSAKGLAEVYEDEYAQKTGLVSTALSFSDEQKKEATMLFKKLCLKLDALSHFHFTPKPVIEDMSIQVNVPALAIERLLHWRCLMQLCLLRKKCLLAKGTSKTKQN